jgi:hypothetical protein
MSGYDNWKLMSPEDEEDEHRRRAQRRIDAEDKAEHDADRASDERADIEECDCCGEMMCRVCKELEEGCTCEVTIDELTCICGELEWNCVCPG